MNLTAVVSISFAFLEHQELTEQEARVLQFDQMITSARSVLRRCGRPPFLRSLWTLWWQLSQALHSMEQVLWPGQPPDAPLNLDLPVEPRPLSDLLLDEFDNAAPSIGPATRALEAFQLWFHQHYDATLHSELDSDVERCRLDLSHDRRHADAQTAMQDPAAGVCSNVLTTFDRCSSGGLFSSRISDQPSESRRW